MVLLTVVAGWIASAISVMKFLCSVPLECFLKNIIPRIYQCKRFQNATINDKNSTIRKEVERDTTSKETETIDGCVSALYLLHFSGK